MVIRPASRAGRQLLSVTSCRAGGWFLTAVVMLGRGVAVRTGSGAALTGDSLALHASMDLVPW